VSEFLLRDRLLSFDRVEKFDHISDYMVLVIQNL